MTALVQQRTSTLWGPLGISVLVHLLLFPFLLSHPFTQPIAPDFGSSSPTRVRLIRQNQNLDSKGQVVDIQDKSNISKEASKDAKYLSDQNRIVQKETQARMTGIPMTGNAGRGSLKEGPQTRALKARGRGYNFGLPPGFLSSVTNGSGRVAPQAPSNYLPDVQGGDETILNTREYIYTAYFVRMKRQIETHWNPLQHVNAYRDRTDTYTSALEITLTPEGKVDEIKLILASGNPGLDQEAITAVKMGQPYLNPPKDLIDRDGKIHIGPWRFIVSMRDRF